MERLKFRAWDKNESRMIYSGTEQNDYPFAWMIHNSGIDIAEHDGTEWNYLKELIFMQYTGLNDKSGKEIYEGDICNCREYECFGKVEWNDDEAGFFFCVVIEGGGFEEERLYEYVDELEIIGNIYENPELLESGE